MKVPVEGRDSRFKAGRGVLVGHRRRRGRGVDVSGDRGFLWGGGGGEGAVRCVAVDVGVGDVFSENVALDGAIPGVLTARLSARPLMRYGPSKVAAVGTRSFSGRRVESVTCFRKT